jgi:glycosyltransferase involved in cell wall biosynthesis
VPSESGPPLVSILTPSYQQGRFLPDCLRSVATQTYPHIEHVVFDGGSTDETLDVLAAAGESVRWTSEPDRGQADAVNKAYTASSGEIVGWLNSDDGFFSTDAVARAVAAFERHPDADVVYGDTAFVDESGLILRHAWARWSMTRVLPLMSPIGQPSAFFRRSALAPDELPLRPELERLLDYELWLRLRSRGARFVHVPVVLGVDRDQPLRKVRDTDDLFVEETEGLIREYGPIIRHRPFERVRGLVRRLFGVVPVLTWEQRYEPAFPWHVDGRARRLLRQVAMLHPIQLTERQRRVGAKSARRWGN